MTLTDIRESLITHLWSTLYPAAPWPGLHEAIATITAEMQMLRLHWITTGPDTNKDGLRPAFRVQQAHDLLSIAIADDKVGALVFQGDTAHVQKLQACSNLEVLCWLLNHSDHAETVTHNLARIRAAVGVALVPPKGHISEVVN